MTLDGLKLVLSKTNKISDTKHNIQCSERSVKTPILVLKQSLVYYASQHSCNEELLWMVDCRMKNHGVNDNNFNIIIYNAQFLYTKRNDKSC